MKKLVKDPYLWIFLIFAFYPMLPYIGNFTSLGTELLLWFIFTLSFNLCLGYTGLPSFGHGAFFGLGSYGAALAFINLFDRQGFFVPLVAAILLGGVFAAFLGYIIRNKKGVYFALLTVVFTQVLFSICWRWDSVTGGESGLMGISRAPFLGMDLKNPIIYYYFVLAVFAVCAIIIRLIADSSFGMSLKAIRQNPIRAQYLGYNTGNFKFAVYLISGLFAGLAGGLYCFLTGSAFADSLDWMKSGDVVIATLLGGGMVSFYGPLVGTVIFLVAKELISALWDHWSLLYGLSFVIIILAFPTGLLGIFKKQG